LLSAAERIKSAAMTAYRLFLSVDIVALFIALYFFFAGISDGSVSSFNIALWLAVLGGLTAVVGGGYALKTRGRTSAGAAVLAVVAIPAILGGLFFLSILIAQPRWN
jgi:hypothetical protein